MMLFNHTNGFEPERAAPRYMIGAALGESPAALAYLVDQELAERFPERALIASEDSDFDVEEFAQAGLCELSYAEIPHALIVAGWRQDTKQITWRLEQGWCRLAWQGQRFELLRLSWPTDCGTVTFRWLLADTRAQAEAFFSAVCAWNSDPGETIMVFQDGHWQKSRELFQSIQRATLSNLVLGGTLKHDLYADLATFFQARAIYAEANIPWKRGIVLIGPPGNGKTHAVKALINALGQKCLYVKSFSAEHVDDHRNIRYVFEEAREHAPCILVLEDLDSLITEHNRSFFLNELDGFAANEGVVTIASTNHPDKLDPAIMARPSRFDRKYHFGLPAAPERLAFLELWAGQLGDAMRPAAATLAGLAAETEGFSFAYLKELLVSSTIRWAERQQPGAMDAIMPAQLAELRTQMDTSEMA